MERSWDFGSLFEDEGYGEGEDKPVGFRARDVKVSLSIPQKEKVIFKGWDMSLRDGVWRTIPEGTVFKVVHVTKDGKFIKGFNPDYTLSDIVFHSTEVEYAKTPVEVKGMDF